MALQRKPLQASKLGQPKLRIQPKVVARGLPNHAFVTILRLFLIIRTFLGRGLGIVSKGPKTWQPAFLHVSLALHESRKRPKSIWQPAFLQVFLALQEGRKRRFEIRRAAARTLEGGSPGGLQWSSKKNKRRKKCIRPQWPKSTW